MTFGKMIPSSKIDSPGDNIILTGIPRSGTTVACRLLCEYSQTIALNEPLVGGLFETPLAAHENIAKQFHVFRNSLLQNGSALARTHEGKITDNAFGPGTGKRDRVVERTTITFDKKLEPNFTLVLKHCAEFTLLLPEIKNNFPLFALIRNPLALLASWATVDVPVSRGKVLKSERLNPEFHNALNNQNDNLLERQLFILSWYFGQYTDLDENQIIRYEELVECPEKVLSGMAKGTLSKPLDSLTNKRSSLFNNQTAIHQISDALLKSEGHYWKYYSKEDVRKLLNNQTTT